GTKRLRKALVVTDELDYALYRIDDVRRLLIHYHLDEHIPGIQLAFDRHFLAVLDLDHFLRWHECLTNLAVLGGARVELDLPLNQRTDLVLVPRRRLNRVPPVFHVVHRENSDGTPRTSTRL